MSQKSIVRAVTIKKGVLSLKACPGYNSYLIPKINREMVSLSLKILEREMPSENREFLRQRYMALKEVVEWADRDLKLAETTLTQSSAGDELMR